MCFLTFPTFKAWGGYSKEAAEQRMAGFNSQELANTAWAFATADSPDAQLFRALARTTEQRMSGFNSPQLAYTAWAFASAG